MRNELRPASAIDRYITAAKQAGCPADQIKYLIRANAVLQPRQLAASAAARLCDRSGGPTQIGYGGARGGGKSHWMLLQMAADDCQRFPGLKCLLLRKVGRALKEGFEDLLRRSLGGLQYDYVASEKRLTFPNGSQIILGHFQNEGDIDAYLGLEYDIIGVEEATTLSASKVKNIRTCCRTSRNDMRPRMYYTTNPGGIGHTWFVERFIKPFRTGAELGTRFIPATVDDNAFVNSEYRGQLEELTGWQLRAWRYGDWDIAVGQFFTTFRRDVHSHPMPWDRPAKEWRVHASLDYGYTHYTVVHLHATDGDGHRYTFDEHAARGWLVEAHAKAIHRMLARWHLRANDLWRIAAGEDVFSKRHTGGTIAAEYKKHGLKLKKANTDRVSGWGELLRVLGDVEHGIAPTWTIDPRCTMLLDCIPALQHDPSHPEDVKKWDMDEDGHGGDDAGDSARYGLMELYRPRMTSASIDLSSGAKRTRATAPALPARSDAEIDKLLNEAA